MKFIDFDREYSGIVHKLETGKITLGEYSDLGEALLNKVKAEALEEFAKSVLAELNRIAENEEYSFNKDHSNLVSAVMYLQIETFKEQE